MTIHKANWLLVGLICLALWPTAAHSQSPAPDLRFEFTGNSAEVPGDAAGKLTLLAEQLLASDTLQVQVKAYAGDSDGGASAARRLSLSRALAVRAFLIDKGVRSTRIELRAPGYRPDGGPPERVDVYLAESEPQVRRSVTSRWESYMAAGVAAHRQGNYPEAEKQFATAFKAAEGFGPQDPRLATNLNNLAELYRARARYAESLVSDNFEVRHIIEPNAAAIAAVHAG